MFIFKTFNIFYKFKIFPNPFKILSYANKEKNEQLYGLKGHNFLILLFLNMHLKQSLWFINNFQKIIKVDSLKGTIKDVKFFSIVFLLMYFATIGTLSVLPFPPIVFVIFILATSTFFSVFIYSMWLNFAIIPINSVFNDLSSTHSRLHKSILDISTALNEEKSNDKISFFYCLFRMFKPYSGEYFEKFKKTQKPFSFMLKTLSFYHLNLHIKQFDYIFPDYKKESKLRLSKTKDKLFFLCLPLILGASYILSANLHNPVFIGFLIFVFFCFSLFILSIFKQHFIGNKDEHMKSIMDYNSLKFVEYFSLHEKSIFNNKIDKNSAPEKTEMVKRRRL